MRQAETSSSYLLHLTLLLALLLSGACAPSRQPEAPVSPSEEPTYLDAGQPVEIRVEDLLARMTLAEKIGQMTLVEKNSISPAGVRESLIGGVLSGGGGYPPSNTPEAWRDMVAAFQEEAKATRLGIPLLYGVDAVHGHNNLKGATIFPHNIGLGAAGDAELVEQIGRATAEEMAATGIYWNFAPVVAVAQDIRWGRTYEAYGEETQAVTDLGVAYMRGLQGDDLTGPTGVMATPKHFIGDGGTAWGTSTTEDYSLDQGDTLVDEATLRAVHLPPYRAAIEAGAWSIMVSFSSWQGEKVHARADLLTDLLKHELGFQGFLVSDWQAIDQIAPDNYAAAVAMAINAGIDMNMVPYDYQRFIATLTQAVEQGDVSEARIDDAVRRILRAKFALGLFDPAKEDGMTPGVIGNPEHRALAREAVTRSVVLLQNNRELLPISPTADRIFVGGEAADDIGIQSGGWTIEWQGKAGNITPGTTILDGITEAVNAETTVHFNRFGRFDRILNDQGAPVIADVGIAVVGEKPYAEGIGDSDNLILSEADLGVIERLRAQSEQLIVILVAGRPLVITEQLDLADAWVVAWLPGSEGAGVADVLFGLEPFQARLPYTWPRSLEQLPQTTAEDPLFPAGFGLITTISE
jgi:beta-glucosidase